MCIVCLMALRFLPAQQANVNLDYNPQKNTENLVPFSATHNSPEVDDDTKTIKLYATCKIAGHSPNCF